MLNAQYHHPQQGAKKVLDATALAGVPQQRVAAPDWDSCAQKSSMAAPCIEHSITSPANHIMIGAAHRLKERNVR
jgi:hypothetical protein